MKKFFLMMFLVCISVCSIAQDYTKSESAKPTFGVTLERECSDIMIEKTIYHNVAIELKAADIGDLFTDGVKVTVTDENGKKIYKKRFSKSYLYVFPSKTIQVGKGNAITQVSLYKNKGGEWEAIIKEKGIY
ncbi:hypothetical protein [Prevotella pallens]|jgi:hypothetical protein|uniref:hypothetical protein n=1 Tax=Prevotella pallens TaxID=60133 RepID=UPI00288C25FA|nr:hypothetical protein [Prevotella pallens]